MSAQPSYFRALAPLNTALLMIENATREPSLEFWHELAKNVRSARDQLINPDPDPLTRRAEFLLLGVIQTTRVSTYYRDGMETPHVEVIEGQEDLHAIVMQEIHRLDKAALLARVGR